MTDTNHHVLTGKVDITSNLLVGSSHLFVDTNNNRVGLVTTNPDAGLHVNSNAYVNTDLRVGSQIEINATAGRVKAVSFEGDGSLLQNTPPGAVGADGAAATIGDPNITTGLAGTDASVTNSGTSSAAVFDFVIPRGDAGTNGTNGTNGDDGAAATIGDPNITTGLAGTDASVTNSGTSSAAVFDFVIPRGDAGTNGTNGTDGTNYFTLSGSNIYRTTGNVGIGTTNPHRLLDVSDSTGETAMHISGMATQSNAFIYMTETSSRNYGAVLHYSGTGSPQGFRVGHLENSTTPRYDFAIDRTSGNVGIGTTSPAYQLDVQGSTAFDGSTTLRILNPAANYGRTQLHLVGRYEAGNDGWSAQGARNAIMFKSQSSQNSAITNQWTIQSFPSSNDLGFLSGTNNTPRVVFRGSNGYVGINTTSPNMTLHVKGSIKMASAGDTYGWVPGNDGWLRLTGGASGQGNMYSTYTSLAVGNFWSSGHVRFSSDDRVKHFEEEIPALEIINQLNPYKYKKTSKIYTEDYTGEIGEEGKDWEWEIGLIAQDIKKIPYLEFSVTDPENGPEGKYGLNYANFIGVCIQGIKEMDRQLQTTKEELQSEKKKTATMELLVASLVKRVGDLENLVI